MTAESVSFRDWESYLKVFGSKVAHSLNSSLSVSVFDLPSDLLRQPRQRSLESSDNATVDVPVSRGLTCHRCGIIFESWLQQRDHFKSESHVKALKRSQDDANISAETISPISAPADDREDSTSDDDEVSSEDSPELVSSSHGQCSYMYTPSRGSQWVMKPSHLTWNLNVSSVILTPNQAKLPFESSWEQLIQTIHRFNESRVWCVFIYRCGKFAGGIFEGKDCLVHKVLHRYTMRAKAGGSQSSFDSKNGKANSIGAQMRRQGEADLKEDIKKLMSAWRDLLASASLILGSSQSMIE